MSNLPTDQEIDDYFNKLKDKFPAITKCPPPKPPSQKLLDLAWEAAKAHNLYRIQNGLAFSQYVTPMAASTDNDVHENNEAYFEYKMPPSIGGGWILTEECMPVDPDWKILKFKCTQDLIETFFKVREIKVRIGDEVFNLGKVNKQGIAILKVPRDLNFFKDVKVSYSAIED